MNSQIWSKDKLFWSQKSVELKFPSYFAMVTGCAVTISKYKVLFIGGHHTIGDKEIQGIIYTILPIQKPINNLVIEYDFEKGAWKNLSSIPFPTVSMNLS